MNLATGARTAMSAPKPAGLTKLAYKAVGAPKACQTTTRAGSRRACSCHLAARDAALSGASPSFQKCCSTTFPLSSLACALSAPFG